MGFLLAGIEGQRGHEATRHDECRRTFRQALVVDGVFLDAGASCLPCKGRTLLVECLSHSEFSFITGCTSTKPRPVVASPPICRSLCPIPVLAVPAPSNTVSRILLASIESWGFLSFSNRSTVAWARPAII